MFKNKKYVYIAAPVVLVLIFLGFLLKISTGPGKLDDFAMCLKDKGVVFYGAFWCPHCQRQKQLFGSSEKYLPYVECSTPDAKGQLAVCTEKGVNGYPTWVFPDQSSASGELTLETLSQKSSCPLPK